MGLPLWRKAVGAGLICAQPALLWLPPLDSADPRLPLLLGLPLAVAGGCVLGGWRALWVPGALAVAATAGLYVMYARDHGDAGILDPVIIALAYLVISLPAVAIGTAVARRLR